MKNITQYVKDYNHSNFEMHPLNPVDILILAEISYFELKRYSSLYSSNRFEKLSLLNDNLIIKKIAKHTLDFKNNDPLFKLMFESERFKDLKLGFYDSSFSSKETMQYASMVFKLGNNYVIAYRGTDMSILGWQEDLNLAYIDKLPSHQRGIDYLKSTIDQIPEGANIFVTGHSKGGNFATYSATNIPKKHQDRIKAVYDFDGPGYKSDIFSKPMFLNIEHKYNKIIPYDSLVGMLLTDYKKYKVVSATGINGIVQHSPFAWSIGESDFEYAPRVSKSSRAFDKALDEWLAGRDDETKKQYTAALFSFLDRCGIKDLSQLSGDVMPLFKKAVAQQKLIKKESKKQAYAALFELGKLFLRYRFSRDV